MTTLCQIYLYLMHADAGSQNRWFCSVNPVLWFGLVNPILQFGSVNPMLLFAGG